MTTNDAYLAVFLGSNTNPRMKASFNPVRISIVTPASASKEAEL
jgi:hypothetical protein